MNGLNVPTVLVIFGATGDLTKRKLAPALYHLSKKGALPQHFAVVGFARRPYSDEAFREHLAEMLSEHHVEAGDINGEFLAHFTYVEGDLSKKNGYVSLQKKLAAIDEAWGLCANKLFYLAVPPELYQSAFTHLAASGLTEPCSDETGWTRVIVEKPFGKNAETAKDLDLLLGKLFKEEQIYRIDHYLAKEMLQNIIAFRFSNNILEHGWSNETVEKIEIRLWEKIGVEKRGAFYDGVGALRDVGQNHLLQMLALVTMPRPAVFSSEAIRAERAALLQKLILPDRAAIESGTRRAQYEGFREIPGVAPHSETETYFRIMAELDAPEWEGVPIMMESGKRMGEPRKEIVVYFRHEEPCLCPPGEHYRNKVVFALEPEERITIHFWAKKPGLTNIMEERRIEFLLREAEQRHQYVEEYEKLLLDCIMGDQALFVNTEEVRAMWRFIDPIVLAWKKGVVPLQNYVPDTAYIADVHAEEETAELPKKIGYIGLGKMGRNMAARLTERGWTVHSYDRDPAAPRTEKDLASLVAALAVPRVVWLMVPSGKPVDETLFGKEGIVPLLKKGDIVIDGGNSFYEDTVRRGKLLSKKGIAYVDVGVSGGPGGARHGASLMIGGDKKIFDRLEPLWRDVAVSRGYRHVGGPGAGHFVKMVHNGIEYGMMQSLAEGFAILKKSPFKLSLGKIADIYNRGSVIESRLVGWLRDAYGAFGEDLKKISGSVGHTGEGAWTVKTAKKLGVAAPVIEQSLKFRVASAKKPSYTGKVLSALRNRFGGHDAGGK